MAKKTRIFSIFSPKAKRLLLAALLCIVNCAFCIPQDIRFHLWAPLDAYPDSETAIKDSEKGQFDFPISNMKEIGPYLIQGMIYGWRFSYTPGDKARGVKEYFELEPVHPEEVVEDQITYEYPWISEDNNRLNCWIRAKRTPAQENIARQWESINNPCIHGRGEGDVEKGFEGFKEGINRAVIDAIRDYYRNEIKNKPKEITGTVLIRRTPVIGIVNGKYSINLDFFLEKGRIIPYSIF